MSKKKRGIPFLDIANMDEDRRIQMIGHRAMHHKEVVAFITDADLGKAERYISKLKQRFPGIVVLGKFPGPVIDTVLVKVGPPDERSN